MLFVWLLLRGRVLTWENIRKRGMKGPFKCALCSDMEETMEHLFHGCKWTCLVWDEGSRSFGQLQMVEGAIEDKIKHREEKIFKNSIVRRLWDLLPGFVVWNVWKECNNHIFEGKRKPLGEIF